MIRLIILSTVMLTFGCKSSKQSSSQKFPIVMMEKTACMGSCPAFIFNVYPDGTATYKGLENVDYIGDFSAKLSDEQIQNLKKLFDDANFLDFANVYSANVTDLPTTFIYYHNGKKNLKVTDYFGAPESLKELEQEVENFIYSIEWIKD